MVQRGLHAPKERQVGLEERDIAPDAASLVRHNPQRVAVCGESLLEQEKPAQTVAVGPRSLGGIEEYSACTSALDLC